MEPTLQRYYEDRLSMMTSKAWGDLIEDVKKMHDSINTLNGATVENLQFRQGEVSILRWLMSIKEVSEESYESLKREDNA